MNYATWWYNSFMRRCFKTRYFQRWMRKTDLTDEALCAAAQEMSQGWWMRIWEVAFTRSALR
jgi:hypothetical protein